MRTLPGLFLGAAALILAGAPALAADRTTESLLALISESQEKHRISCPEATAGLKQFEDDFIICQDTSKQELGRMTTRNLHTDKPIDIPAGVQTNCFITTRKIGKGDSFFLYLSDRFNSTVELGFTMTESADKKLKLELVKVTPVQLELTGGRREITLSATQKTKFKEALTFGTWFVKLKKDAFW